MHDAQHTVHGFRVEQRVIREATQEYYCMLLLWVQRFVQWSDWFTEFGTGGICLISNKWTTIGHCTCGAG